MNFKRTSFSVKSYSFVQFQWSECKFFRHFNYNFLCALIFSFQKWFVSDIETRTHTLYTSYRAFLSNGHSPRPVYYTLCVFRSQSELFFKANEYFIMLIGIQKHASKFERLLIFINIIEKFKIRCLSMQGHSCNHSVNLK